MESLEKRYGDNLLYHIRGGVLQKLKKSAEFRELSREADELSRKFQIITDLFEGVHMEDIHELTKEERQAVLNYVRFHRGMMEEREVVHYYQGYGDCMLHLKRCGFLDEKRENKLSIEAMAELIRIHDAYKSLNIALFGSEMSLMFDEGFMGALGRIYEVIDNNVTESMKNAYSEILADTSIEPKVRASMLLQEID